MKINLTTPFLSITLIVFMISVMAAQVEKVQSTQPVTFRFGMDLGKMAIETDVAEALEVSEDAWSFIRMGGGISFLKFVFADLGFGIYHFKDKAEFTQWVVGGVLGNLPRQAKSGITSGELYGNAGIRIPLLSRLAAEGMYGQSRISLTRKIERCNDCRKEKLDFEGGNFLQYRLLYLSGDRNVSGGFSLSYRQFLGESDSQNLFLLGILLQT